MSKRFIRWMIMVVVLMLRILTAGHDASGDFDKDPVLETQTDAVKVTEELLTSEGQAGPASPSFKMEDTSEFLTEEPYVGDEEYLEPDVEPEDDESPWWEDWFFWGGDDSEK